MWLSHKKCLITHWKISTFHLLISTESFNLISISVVNVFLLQRLNSSTKVGLIVSMYYNYTHLNTVGFLNQNQLSLLCYFLSLCLFFLSLWIHFVFLFIVSGHLNTHFPHSLWPMVPLTSWVCGLIFIGLLKKKHLWPKSICYYNIVCPCV